MFTPDIMMYVLAVEDYTVFNEFMVETNQQLNEAALHRMSKQTTRAPPSN